MLNETWVRLAIHLVQESFWERVSKVGSEHPSENPSFKVAAVRVRGLTVVVHLLQISKSRL